MLPTQNDIGLQTAFRPRLLLAALAVAAATLALGTATVSATAPVANGKIAYVRDGDVWVMDADGANQQNLTSSASSAEADPAFSPDATQLAFTRDGDLWVMNADGSDQTNLTNDSAADRDPDWSPGGTQIVFMSDRERFNSELGHDVLYRGMYLMDAARGDAAVLTETPIFAGSDDFWVDPAWSPTENKIAFTGNDTDSPRIATVSAADGTGYTLLGPLGGTSPSWSPDGSKIAFDGNTMNADGGAVTPFGDPGDEPRLRPSWSPDGAKIAYEKFGRIFVSGADGLGEVDLMGPDCECAASQPDWGVGTAAPPPAKPSLSIGGATVTEGDSGTVDATFTVTLSTASASTVEVDYATSDGTASAPADYAAASGTLQFAPGDTSESVAVAVQGDVLDEADETFTINLANPSNATIDDGAGLGTILDDDAQPSISIDDVSVLEGDAGTTPATFTVSLSAASGREVTVLYIVNSGTATNPSDYQFPLGLQTLTFAPGDTSESIVVNVNGDALDEPDETFTVDLSGPTNASLADAQGLGTILDDDDAAAPTVSVADATTTEPSGESGFTGVNLVVSLSGPSGTMVTVDYATADGTAVAPGDYEAQSGTLELAPGETEKAINVKVFADAPDEYDETFLVNLSNAASAMLADPSGTATIVDSDAPPVVSTNVRLAVTEGHSGTTSKFATVALTDPSEKDVSVDFSTTENAGPQASATAGMDYHSASGTVEFARGQTVATVELLVIGDTLEEPDERFLLELSRPADARFSEFLASVAEIDIRDDEGPETTVGIVQPGETLTSDVEGDGATPSDPIEISVTSPNGGIVSIDEQPMPPSGWVAWLSAPTATPENPLVIVYRTDASWLAPGIDETNLQILRCDFAGCVPVPECTGTSGTASPDPCVSRRDLLVDGDVQLTVLASHASEWRVGGTSSSAGSAAGILQPSSGGAAAFAVRSDGTSVQGAMGFTHGSFRYAGKVTTMLVAPNGKSAWLGGVDRNDRTFVAYIEDNGRNGRGDVFKLWIDGVLKTGDGALKKGDVVIKH
jgi:Tol biopolymer transport system component